MLLCLLFPSLCCNFSSKNIELLCYTKNVRPDGYEPIPFFTFVKNLFEEELLDIFTYNINFIA